MPSLFDIGKSGLQAYRNSLAVTGQNIANINTEGYKKRDAALAEVSAAGGGGSKRRNQSHNDISSTMPPSNKSSSSSFQSTGGSAPRSDRQQQYMSHQYQTGDYFSQADTRYISS